MKSLSDRIIEGMAIRNMKQVDIIEATGINKGSLSSYISGKYEPKQTNIYKIAKALDVNEAWLMGHDVPMERKSTKITQSPATIDSSCTPSQHEQALLHKYRSIDDKGKHTVDTVLEMEYNRCKSTKSAKVAIIRPKEDKLHLVPEAAHQRTDLSEDELNDAARNKHDDDIMDDPNF